MATASPGTDTLAVARWGDGEDGSKSDRYLAERLAAAGADVKGVAVATFVLAAAVATLLWLAVGVAADHWLFVGGVPAWARWCWLGAGVVALAAAIVRWIVPLVRYRVNLVFAARAIERDYPELHNDLVNTVLVKARPDATVAPVVRSLERRAAKRLAHVPTDGVIDRTTTLRLALALAALVVAATLYGLLAPKSLLTTAARLMAPWARITPPTRVAIDPPRLAWRRPGEPPAEANHPTRELEAVAGVVRVVRGRQLVVSTTVRGLRGDERATLVVRPAEGGDRGWDALMAAGTPGPAGQERHVAVLPDDARGLDDSLDVVIAAGDARTEPLRIAVVDTPSLLVREARYEYPAYTGRAAETVAWQGDLRAVEGTTVALMAEANGPLEAAWVDFDCDGTNDLELAVGRQEPHRATGRFRLRLDADRARPWHESYRLVFVPRGSGGSRADPVTEQLEHRIEVLPDLAPEVTIESPREPVVAVPPDAPVAIAVRALDPDFGLARVTVELRLKGEPPLPARPLLEEPRGGPFRGATRLVPAEVGAGPGAVIEYRAVAVDTRPEEPNVAASRWQTLRVDAAAPPPRQPDVPPPDAERPREQGQSGNGRQPERPADAPRRDDAKDEGTQQRGDQSKDERKDTPENAPQGGPREEPQAGPKDDRKDDGTSADRQPGAPRPGAGANETAQDGPERPQDGAASREPGGPRQPDEQRQPGAEPDAASPPGGEPRRGDTPRGQPQPDAAGDPQQGDGQERGGSATQGERPADGQRGLAGDGSEDRGALAADGTNDGEVMERILEHKKQEERGRQGDATREPSTGRDGKADEARRPDAGQPGAGEQPQRTGREGGEQGSPTPGQQGGAKPGEGEPGEGKPGEGRPGEGKGGEGQPGQGKPGARQGDEAKPGDSAQGTQGEAKPGEGKPGEGKPGEGKPGEGKPGEGKGGEGQPGQGKPGARQGDEAKPGDSAQGTQGEAKSGEGEPGEAKPGEGKQGEAKPGEGKPGEGKPGEGKPGEGKPGEGKPGEGKPGEGKPGEGKGGEGQPGQGKPGARQGDEAKPGDSAQGTQGEAKSGEGEPGEAKPGEGKQGEAKPGEGKPGDSAQGKPGEGEPGADEGQIGAGKPDQGQRGAGKPDEGTPGTDDGQPGAGKPDQGQPREGASGEGKQGDGQPSEGEAGQGQGRPADGKAGEDRPGRGQSGQGQSGEGKPGEGKPGEGKPGEGKPGEGKPGEGKPGEGKPGEGKPGEGKPGEGKPGEGKPGEGKPGEGKPGEGKPGEGQGAAPGGTEPAGSSVGAGGATGGDRGEGAPVAADDAAPERREMEWTDTDLSHARNAADLALEHLRNNLAAGRTDVLDRLGWTPQQAQAFLERWQEMRRLADSPDPRQRGEFERTLRSLGLRPEGVRSSRDAPSDTKGGQAEGRRSRPPSSYREQFEAYLRGTAGE